MSMRRVAAVIGGLFLLVAASAVPAFADTTGGGNQLQSGSTSCSAGVCTDTNVSAFVDPFGPATACVDIFAFDQGTKDMISEESGCADASSFVITTALAATLGPTSIDLSLCDSNNACSASRTIVVSATDSPTGRISTTS